ncbi:MAG: DUF5615 family PIN-like protein [Saprospiraceae bacterium]
MSLQDFQFLTDENIDAELVEFLRQQGFDVLDIKEMRMFRLPDKDVLGMAYAQNRVVISQDSDFGTLIFRDKAPFIGVIYLRPGHQSPQIHIESFQAILDGQLELAVPFVLVAENTGEMVKIRLRTL